MAEIQVQNLQDYNNYIALHQRNRIRFNRIKRVSMKLYEVDRELSDLVFPKSCEFIKIEQGLLSELPKLPNKLLHLEIDSCDVEESKNINDIFIHELPNTLHTLILNNCGFTVLPTLPFGLKKLDVAQNNLTSLPILPSHLVECNISLNQFSQFPTFPDSLEKLIIMNTLDDPDENPLDDEYLDALKNSMYKKDEDYEPDEEDEDEDEEDQEEYKSELDKMNIAKLNVLMMKSGLPRFVSERDYSVSNPNAIFEFIILNQNDLDTFMNGRFNKIKKMVIDGLDFDTMMDERTFKNFLKKLPARLEQLEFYNKIYTLHSTKPFPIQRFKLKYLTCHSFFKKDGENDPVAIPLPSTIVGVNIQYNEFPCGIDINSGLTNLKYLNYSNNYNLKSEDLNDIPEGIVELNVQKNPAYQFSDYLYFPDLVVLNCSLTRADIYNLQGYPDGLKELYMSYCGLDYIDTNFPESLQILDCRGNAQLPELLEILIDQFYMRHFKVNDLTELYSYPVWISPRTKINKLVSVIKDYYDNEPQSQPHDEEDDEDDDDDEEGDEEGDEEDDEEDDEGEDEGEDEGDEGEDEDEDDEGERNKNDTNVIKKSINIRSDELYDKYVLEQKVYESIVIRELELDELILFEGMNEIKLYHCVIKSPIKMPKSLTKFFMHDSAIVHFPDFPDTLLDISITDSIFEDIQENNTSPASNNDLTILKLPANLKNLMIIGCNLIKLPDKMPTNLMTIHCANNKLTTLPPLPESIKLFNISNNNISHIDHLHNFPHLEIFICFGNPLTTFPKLPSTIKEIRYSSSSEVRHSSINKVISTILDKFSQNTGYISTLTPMGKTMMGNLIDFLNSIYYDMFDALLAKNVINRVKSGDFNPTYLFPLTTDLSLLMFFIKGKLKSHAYELIKTGNYYPDFISPINGNALLFALSSPENFMDLAVQLINDGKCKFGSVNHKGYTPLIVACERSEIDIANLLIKKGKECMPSQITTTGITALSCAIQNLPSLAESIFDLHPGSCLVEHEKIIEFARNAKLDSLVDKMELFVKNACTYNLADSGYDIISAENVNIKKYLDEDPTHLSFKIGNSYFLVSKNTISIQSKIANNIKYRCVIPSNNLVVAGDDKNIIFDISYLSMNSLFSLSSVLDLNLLNDKIATANGSDYASRIFVLVPHRWAPAVMSLAYYNGEIGASADHCATGKAVFIFNILGGTLAEQAEDATIDSESKRSTAKTPSSIERGEKVKVMLRNVIYEIAISDTTTIGELKENLTEIVKDTQPDIKANNITLIYSGKMYKNEQDTMIVKSIPGFIAGMTFLTRVLVSASGGSRASAKKTKRINQLNAMFKKMTGKYLEKLMKHTKTMRHRKNSGLAKTYKHK